jgi:hypothetical protein
MEKAPKNWAIQIVSNVYIHYGIQIPFEALRQKNNWCEHVEIDGEKFNERVYISYLRILEDIS